MIDDLTLRAQSFLAASTVPIKLLQCSSAVVNGHINPVHIQLIPTNRCNGHCSWCVCRNVDRHEELSSEELWDIATTFYGWGARAVTLTGGGEPTLHEGLPRLIGNMGRLGYKIGMVTNGFYMPDSLVAVGQHLTYIRVSNATRELGSVTNRAEYVASLFPTTDIGISYTVTADVDVVDARSIAECACDVPNITYVRYVTDLTDVDEAVLAMTQLESNLSAISPKLIFEYRNRFETGGRCRVGLLKPLIGPDGYIYPCCGVNVADIPGTISWSMSPRARMCHWRDFQSASSFDGSQCQRCYYGEYNRVLALMTTSIGHRDFV